MDNQVFVFGSFSEDEASHFQFTSLSPRRKDRWGSGFSGAELIKNGDAVDVLDGTPSAIAATINGTLNPEESVDVGINLASLAVKEKSYSVSCNGGSGVSANGYHVGNGFLSDETIELTVGANGNISSMGHTLKDEGLHVESNSSTPRVGTPHGRARFNDEIPLSPAKGAGKTWAFLLDDEDSGSPRGKDSRSAEMMNSKDFGTIQVAELSGDLWLQSLREADITGKRLQPRGLINKGNLCFLNATLQALLSCSPFVHLLHTLQAHGVPEVGYPTLRACVDFFKEFEFQQHDKSTKVFMDVGKPFVPSMFDNILHLFNPHQPATGAPRSRQEDAQEFLSFTMDHLHDELLRLDENKQNVVVSQNIMAPQSSEGDDWETVGPKNRTAVVRTHTFCKSALSDIFRGELCSVVKTKGSKASATVQPFLVLHLDILPEAVHTVEDALRLFAAPETLEGYRATAGKAAVVSASKSVKLQSLPQVLILHVKRFSYGLQGSSKLHKLLHFPLNLTLGRDLLATGSSGSESRNYELVATVTHHGKDPSRGHYTAHSKQLNGQWLRYDDGVVSTVGVSRVLQDLVYLLFYKRFVNTQ